MEYLLSKSEISHKGLDGSSLIKRVATEGATALISGEIIGFSPSLDKLLLSWKMSRTHNDVLLNSEWNWIGISFLKKDNIYVSVINFSSGNLGSTKITKIGNDIRFEGEFILIPNFNGNFEVIDTEISQNNFSLYIRSNKKNFFIYVFDNLGNLTDRVDIFFLPCKVVCPFFFKFLPPLSMVC